MTRRPRQPRTPSTDGPTLAQPTPQTEDVGQLRTTKLTARIPTELQRRLKAYAAWHGQDVAAVLATALESHLAGFYCARRTSRDHLPPEPTQQPQEDAPERLAG